MNPPRDSPEATVRRLQDLVRRWHQAVRERDVEALDSIWDETYISTGPDGHRVTKSEELEIVASPLLTFHMLDVGDIEVRVYGDTAVVLGTSRSRGEYNGEDASGAYRFTAVFRRSEAGWRAVVSHGSRVLGEDGATTRHWR